MAAQQGGADSTGAGFVAKTEEHLESHEVYDLLGGLLKKLIIHQPPGDEIIQFLIDELQKKPGACVIIMGPPGIQKTAIAKLVAESLSLPHISCGALLKSKFSSTIASGEYVGDDDVWKLVSGELKKNDSWVLSGFPRTRVQARLMQSNTCLPDKFILLHSYKNEANIHGVEQVKEHLYWRNIFGTVELFENVVCQLPCDAAVPEMAKIIERVVSLRAFSNAPLRPMRACIVGPVGAGRSTQSELLARAYGAVHVDVEALLLEQQEHYNMSRQDYVPVEEVSNEELCKIVGQRLRQADCLRKGWILDGFPKTLEQARFLRSSNFTPSRVVHLTVEEAVSLQRLSGRMVDPVTGHVYYAAPAAVAVRQRLVKAKADQPEKVKSRFQEHVENAESVLNEFSWIKTTIRGNAPAPSVCEQIMDFFERPLPRETTQQESGK
mmetsp:Transcript_39220/g.94289  ORF Transcript_39220/g.94289 Transcript_39220/m.94289 type:complete len:437 (-) Transcript_39220:167-1477(-)